MLVEPQNTQRDRGPQPNQQEEQNEHGGHGEHGGTTKSGEGESFSLCAFSRFLYPGAPRVPRVSLTRRYEEKTCQKTRSCGLLHKELLS